MAPCPPASSATIAIDIETCPLPEGSLSKEQKKRLSSEMDFRRGRRPEELTGEDLEDEKRLARSTHPMLGWVCCVSLYRREGSKALSPVSFLAGSPEEEGYLLDDFWEHVDQAPRSATWVTFNGKDFDVPFLQMRSLARGVEPAQSGLNNTYPYSHEPHADLMKVWSKSYYTLEQLCSHLGIGSPKEEVDGSDVAALVEEEDLQTVADYYERDAEAMLKCWQAMKPLLEKLS